MEFQERFNEILQKSDKTQEEIANAINISEKRISNYISGKSEPNGKILFKICKYLNVSSDYLLGLSNSPKFKTRSGKERESSLRSESCFVFVIIQYWLLAFSGCRREYALRRGRKLSLSFIGPFMQGLCPCTPQGRATRKERH